jgi:hypothetical protein
MNASAVASMIQGGTEHDHPIPEAVFIPAAGTSKQTWMPHRLATEMAERLAPGLLNFREALLAQAIFSWA